MFRLCWHEHGGSGLGLSWDEALDLDLADRNWLYERVNKQRKDEARTLEKAAKKKH
jgi:hypothetical protein